MIEKIKPNKNEGRVKSYVSESEQDHDPWYAARTSSESGVGGRKKDIEYGPSATATAGVLDGWIS